MDEKRFLVEMSVSVDARWPLTTHLSDESDGVEVTRVRPWLQNNTVVQFVSMWQSLDDDTLSPEQLKLACRAKFEALR